MIEFNGYINEKAEKFYWEKNRGMNLYFWIVTTVLTLAIILIISITTEIWYILCIGVVGCAILFALCFLPPSKKDREKFLPKLIYTEYEFIISQGNGYRESHVIDEAVKLVDYGEFYFIDFPFGQKTNKFICQKNLLTKGTLEEFEALFEGKIERRESKI